MLAVSDPNQDADVALFLDCAMYVRLFFFFFFFTNLHVFNHQLNSFAFYAPCSVRFDCLHILLGKAWSSGLLVLARLLQIPPLLWRIRFYNVRRDKLSSTSASTFVRKNEACSLHKFRRTFDVFLRTLELYVPQVTEVGIYPEEENLCTVTQSLSSFKDCRYDVYAGDIGLLQSCSAACTVPRSLSSFFFFFFFWFFPNRNCVICFTSHVLPSIHSSSRRPLLRAIV